MKLSRKGKLYRDNLAAAILKLHAAPVVTVGDTASYLLPYLPASYGLIPDPQLAAKNLIEGRSVLCVNLRSTCPVNLSSFNTTVAMHLHTCELNLAAYATYFQTPYLLLSDCAYLYSHLQDYRLDSDLTKATRDSIPDSLLADRSRIWCLRRNDT